MNRQQNSNVVLGLLTSSLFLETDAAKTNCGPQHCLCGRKKKYGLIARQYATVVGSSWMF
jgi:hypothetical protein